MTRLDWQSECPGLEIIDGGLSGGTSIGGRGRGEGAVRKGREEGKRVARGMMRVKRREWKGT